MILQKYTMRNQHQLQLCDSSLYIISQPRKYAIKVANRIRISEDLKARILINLLLDPGKYGTMLTHRENFYVLNLG